MKAIFKLLMSLKGDTIKKKKTFCHKFVSKLNSLPNYLENQQLNRLAK